MTEIQYPYTTHSLNNETEFVIIEKELNFYNFKKIQNYLLDKITNDDIKNIIIYIKNALHIDSSGFSLLFNVKKHIKGKVIFIANFQTTIIEIMKSLGILQYVSYYRNFNDAFEELRAIDIIIPKELI